MFEDGPSRCKETEFASDNIGKDSFCPFEEVIVVIEKINELAGVGSVSGVKRRHGVGFGADGETSSDGLAVSAFAREMAKISSELSKIPEIREDRVKDLKRQVEDGTYDPNLKALAGRLIWAGINKIED
jgi:negative regulator of flagellin synthesis FlgM